MGDADELADVRWVRIQEVPRYIPDGLYSRVAKKLDHLARRGGMSRAVIGIVRKGSAVLMVRRRIGEGTLRWQFPGGSVEPGEPDTAGVEREVFEETGVSCKAISDLGEWRHPDTAMPISYWGCEYILGEPTVREPGVLDRVEWVEIGDILARITTELYPGVRRYLLGSTSG